MKQILQSIKLVRQLGHILDQIYQLSGKLDQIVV